MCVGAGELGVLLLRGVVPLNALRQRLLSVLLIIRKSVRRKMNPDGLGRFDTKKHANLRVRLFASRILQSKVQLKTSSWA